MTPDIIAALEAFAAYADPRRSVPASMPVTSGSSMARKQLTMGDCYAAADALAALSTSPAGQEVRAWEYESPEGDQRLVQCHRAERGEHPYWIERPLSYATHPAPALDGVSEAYRRGIYDAKCWLRDQQHKNPPDSLWHAAAILADRMDVALLSSPSEGESATVSREANWDEEGHTADAIRDALLIFGKGVISFDKSRDMAAHVIKHVNQFRPCSTPATSTERGR